MPRMLRVEYPGAVYHVMARGNNGQLIYRGDSDRKIFMETLSECCRKTGWRIHAYVLMDNHYHILLETPEPNLVSGMKWLQGTYTQRFNRANERKGHLFQGRYKALLVDPDEPEYFQIVSDYIHLNPVRSRRMDPTLMSKQANPWSSYGFYLKSPAQRPEWLETKRVLSSSVYGRDCSRTRELYRQYMNQRAIEELDGEHREELDKNRRGIRRGWMIGGEAYRERMLEMLANRGAVGTDNWRGAQKREHGERQARQMIGMALKALNMNESEMLESKGTRPEKQAIAWLVRHYTTMTGEWIAIRLKMGHRVTVSRASSEFERATDRPRMALKKKMLQCTG